MGTAAMGAVMGIQNVSLAYARWVHLPDRAFRLLTFMALRSIDEDDPPLYWGGRETLAYALGRMTPVEPAVSDGGARAELNRKARAADFEAVKVALRPLFGAGVACIHSTPSPGRNAVYSLHLMAATGKAEPEQQGRLSLATGKAEPEQQGRLSLPPRSSPPTGGYPDHEELGTNRGNQLTPNVSSPGAELTLEESSNLLRSLPDLGTEYMARAHAENPDQGLVIAAARMAIADGKVTRLAIVKGETA